MLFFGTLTISFAILSGAFPQSPKAPSQAEGSKGGAAAKGGKGSSKGSGLSSGLGALGSLFSSPPPGSDGPDLRGLAEFLKTPSIPKLLGTFGITGLDPLWKVPEIQKYGAEYLDWRNFSNIPFIKVMPNGPSPTGCSPYEMIIARGTGEVGEAFGFIVGDPLLKKVKQSLPEVRGYAVQYPANMSPESPKIGAEDVISRIQKQHKECPTQKFAIVGYSQGSAVMRSALGDAKKVGPAFKQIVAGAMFGGPKGGESFGGGMGGIPLGIMGGKGEAPKGGAAGTPPATGGAVPKFGPPAFAGPMPKFDQGLEEKVRWNCAKGDPACTPGSINVIMHLTYNNPDTDFMSKSAAWIVAGFKGEPVPPKGEVPV